MKLTFLGATHEVTGSCYLLEACQKRVLIDYGMEQGEDIFENVELPVKPSDIDMVLLTHAHMDHSGKLPLLYKEGFQGQIFSTAATADLCEIMLRDSAHIQMFEAEWKNRKVCAQAVRWCSHSMIWKTQKGRCGALCAADMVRRYELRRG